MEFPTLMVQILGVWIFATDVIRWLKLRKFHQDGHIDQYNVMCFIYWPYFYVRLKMFPILKFAVALFSVLSLLIIKMISRYTTFPEEKKLCQIY